MPKELLSNPRTTRLHSSVQFLWGQQKRGLKKILYEPKSTETEDSFKNVDLTSGKGNFLVFTVCYSNCMEQCIMDTRLRGCRMIPMLFHPLQNNMSSVCYNMSSTMAP